jgi:Mn2+/Fe2+ NRAMP family transporter
MGWERGVNKTFREAPQFMWIYTAMIVAGAVIVLIPGAPLVFLMVLASVVNGLLLPAVLVLCLSLVNSEKLMGEFVNPRSYNYVTWATVIVVILFAAAMVVAALVPMQIS